ncbi:MAG: hypothetical protein ABUK20_06790, partial [Anaerolineales bacterium]
DGIVPRLEHGAKHGFWILALHQSSPIEIQVRKFIPLLRIRTRQGMSEGDTPEKPLSLYSDWEGVHVLRDNALKDCALAFKPFMKG